MNAYKALAIGNITANWVLVVAAAVLYSMGNTAGAIDLSLAAAVSGFLALVSYRSYRIVSGKNAV